MTDDKRYTLEPVALTPGCTAHVKREMTPAEIEAEEAATRMPAGLAPLDVWVVAHGEDHYGHSRPFWAFATEAEAEAFAQVMNAKHPSKWGDDAYDVIRTEMPEACR